VLPKLANEFFGPGFEMVWDEAVIKLPHGTRSYPWHQDEAYFSSRETVSAYLALTDVNSGGMTFIPGSHRLGSVPHVATDLGLAIVDESLLEGATPLPLSAGALLLVHPLLIHRGDNNLSENPVGSYTIVLAPGPSS
jgi:phytanoyl-CoA hydroxylase